MARPARYTREQLQSAALALVDEHGLAALSMRSLAAALGTGAMTLYNYVGEREELDLLVIEAVLAKVDWPRDARQPWHEAVRTIATAMWRAVREHPQTIALILTRRSRSPAVLEVSEALLQALARSGRDGRELLEALRAVTALVMGMAQVELAGPLSLHAGESAPATLARFAALPSDRFPRLIEVAKAAAGSHADAEFQAALELLIAGLRVRKPRRTATVRPR